MNESYQLHANANVSGRDMALRVTLTRYDEHGNTLEDRTWRAHTVAPQFQELEWTAAVCTTELAKLLRRRLHDPALADDIDPDIQLPLF